MRYVYRCPAGRTVEIEHRMFYSTAVVCEICGGEMYKVPQPFMVNWGGLKPSMGEPTHEVQELLDTADQRRAEFEAVHEAHEKRTANESVLQSSETV